MKIKDNDIAFVYKIHLGTLRDGKPFLETDLMENVLGDVVHKRCLGVMARVAQLILEDFLNKHFGEGISEEELAEVTVDDVMDFFDKNRDISDE